MVLVSLSILPVTVKLLLPVLKVMSPARMILPVYVWAPPVVMFWKMTILLAVTESRPLAETDWNARSFASTIVIFVPLAVMVLNKLVALFRVILPLVPVPVETKFAVSAIVKLPAPD